MSDEEGGYEEAENEAEDTGAREEEKSKSKKHVAEEKHEEKLIVFYRKHVAEEKHEEKTEAQLLMEAKQKKHEEEERERIAALEEQRREEREKEEDELRRLKEKQAQRKKEREEEERKLEIQRQQQEEQRKQEEEQRKQEKEDEKRRKVEEAERKKAAATAAIAGGRNFVVNRESGESSMDKFMNISKAKTEMGLNTNELEVLKRRTIEDRVKPLSVADMDFKSLQKKAEELWKQIVGLETSKYDLVERSKRQEYDLKELNERQRQTNQKRYVAQGLDVEAGNKHHPPKVQIVSKYERRTDRRTFVDRKVLFDGSNLNNEQKEVARPKAVKRDNWIKPKEVEKKRGSRDEAEDEDEQPTYQNQSSRHEEDESHQQEEVAAQEEEE